jgi:hypothetical protein
LKTRKRKEHRRIAMDLNTPAKLLLEEAKRRVESNLSMKDYITFIMRRCRNKYSHSCNRPLITITAKLLLNPVETG